MASESTLWAERAVRAANLCLIVHQKMTLARAQLSQYRALGARQRLLARKRIRVRSLEESAMVHGGDGVGDGGGVDVFDDVSVACWINGAVDKVRTDRVNVFVVVVFVDAVVLIAVVVYSIN